MIKEYRKMRGYTQEELAELLSKNTRTIQRIEEDENQLTLDNLKQLIKILKINDKDIIEFIKKDTNK